MKIIINTGYWFLGIISFLIGLIGCVLPIIPGLPFFAISIYCFSKASNKFKNWFVSNSLYKKYLEKYIGKYFK